MINRYLPIAKYLGAFLLIYFLLFGIFSIPSVAEGATNTYRKITQPIFQAIYPDAYLRLDPDPAKKPNPNLIRVIYSSQAEVDRQIQFARQRGDNRINMSGISYDLYFNLLFTTYIIYLITLIIITPIHWKSKLWAVCLGSVIFFIFTVFKVAILLLNLFNKSATDMYKLGDFGTAFVERLAVLLGSLGFSAFIVILIWVLVAFRKSNWRKLLDFSPKR